MEPARLSVFTAFFAYGGNGGIGMQLPQITLWWARTAAQMVADQRISRAEAQIFGDIPLTMERNRAVKVAKDGGFDVIMMIDSDNQPDINLGLRPWAKPFWQSSFDFLYERKVRGLPTVVAAPYCGPPPHPQRGGLENVYVFYAEDIESGRPEPCYRFVGYSREHAASMRGIQPIAAGPTGCILYTADAFDLMPVGRQTVGDILVDVRNGKVSIERAEQLLAMQSWFFYEFTDRCQTQKASTEDVTNTREIQLAGLTRHREPIVFCNWDAWAGHYKPKCVGMPDPVHIEEVNAMYREAVLRDASLYDTREEIDFTHNLPATDQHQREIVEEAPPEPAPDVADKPGVSVNGVPMIHRMVHGRVVKTVGNATPMEDLNGLTELVDVIAKSVVDRPLRVIEVGSWVGESALALRAGFGPQGGTVYCVDTWEGSPTDCTSDYARDLGADTLFDIFRENVGDLLDTEIKAVRGESVEVAKSMDPQGADLIFLDARHDYESMRDDLEAWFPHLQDNGVFCGHDFTEGFPGVIRAVKEFTDAHNTRPCVLANTCLWVLMKRECLEGVKKARKRRKQVESEPVEVGHDGHAADTAD